MKLILVIAGRFPTCALSKNLWYTECLKHNIELDVLDFENKNGQTFATKLNLKSFPALILDKKIIAVGCPDSKTAEKIITDLISY